jgi:hypothetical protein
LGKCSSGGKEPCHGDQWPSLSNILKDSFW